MSLDDLSKWREKFDTMKIKYWKTNPIQPVMEKFSGKAVKNETSISSARTVY